MTKNEKKRPIALTFSQSAAIYKNLVLNSLAVGGEGAAKLDKNNWVE